MSLCLLSVLYSDMWLSTLINHSVVPPNKSKYNATIRSKRCRWRTSNEVLHRFSIVISFSEQLQVYTTTNTSVFNPSTGLCSQVLQLISWWEGTDCTCCHYQWSESGYIVTNRHNTAYTGNLKQGVLLSSFLPANKHLGQLFPRLHLKVVVLLYRSGTEMTTIIIGWDYFQGAPGFYSIEVGGGGRRQVGEPQKYFSRCSNFRHFGPGLTHPEFFDWYCVLLLALGKFIF